MLSELCMRRPVFATMLVMSLVVLGIFSFRDLGVDLFPKADPATVNVALQLPGASPGEMSTSIVEPVEQALSSIAGIDEMQSRIFEGSAQITVKFVLGSFSPCCSSRWPTRSAISWNLRMRGCDSGAGGAGSPQRLRGSCPRRSDPTHPELDGGE